MQGSTIPIIFGITTACCVVLFFIIYFLTRCFSKRDRSKYRQLIASSVHGETKKALSATTIHSMQRTSELKTVMQRVDSWSETLPKEQLNIRKPRSISCPVQPELTRNTAEAPHAAEKTKKGRVATSKRTTRQRAITDCSFHVCQLQCSLFYNYYNYKLLVKVICAVNIPVVFGVTYASYVKLLLLTAAEKEVEKRVTGIQYHSNNPVFDESFQFDNVEEILSKQLQMKLFTVDRFSHSSFAGMIIIDFSELSMDATKPTIIWRPVSFNINKSESSQSLADVLDKGELYLSLRYQLFSNKLTIVIMKATNLPQGNKIMSIEPYIVVKLLLHSQVTKVRKTSCKWRTTNPCWNEPLVFEIDSKIPISEYSLCVRIMSHNNFSHDLCIGELRLGYDSDGLYKQHWKEMIMKKNQDRAMCHKIN